MWQRSFPVDIPRHKLYCGPLSILKMNPIQKKAYKTWKDQRNRCNNPNDPRHYCYGNKGIKVEYSSREFIFWYENEYTKIPAHWKRVQCGRKDHAKNYSLDNIQLESCSDNTKERNARLGNPGLNNKRNPYTGQFIKTVKSLS